MHINKNKEIFINYFIEKFGQAPDSISNKSERAKMLAEIFDYILPQAFKQKADCSSLLESKFTAFEKNIIPELKQSINKRIKSNGNIYDMFGATSLSSANLVTRKLNTKLGLFWEEIASLSSNVISPELHFGIKIPGVDVIVQHNNKFYYTQLKTQKNTLSGSDSSRVTQELSLFDNSWFVACIDNCAGWTYSGSIQRLLGNEFWSKTDINYEDLLSHLNNTINLVEKLLN